MMKTLQNLVLTALVSCAIDAQGAAPRPLYYTYRFENDASVAKAGSFFDRLPEGLVWDTTYVPVTTGGLAVDVVYSNANRDASVAAMMLPPGNSSITLCTVATTKTGTIDNDATLTPVGGDPIDAQASLNLGEVKYGDIRVALLVDESGSIDASEAAEIRSGLSQFFSQEVDSGNLISLIGMSEGVSDLRSDHVVEAEVTKLSFDTWVNNYHLGRVGAQADYWASALEVASSGGSLDLVVIIGDGIQGDRSQMADQVAQLRSNGTHVFFLGLDPGNTSA